MERQLEDSAIQYVAEHIAEQPSLAGVAQVS